ncbi:MAG TPA: hypothetical protein VJN95_05115 [Gemmatimonadales bacterium]|nr:hypothetical protein [Gemmatimonadales bacterium]
MRSRDRILANLDTVYQESYDRAKAEQMTRRMEELDAAYLRDQLMMEVLLDIRDLLDRTPRKAEPGTVEQLAKLSSIVRKP